MGAELSMASATFGSLEKVAVSAPIKLRDGVVIHTITHGSSPRTTKTANIIPQNKNHRRALALIPESTSAFIMALSMLDIVSKRDKPIIGISNENKSMTPRLVMFYAARKLAQILPFYQGKS